MFDKLLLKVSLVIISAATAIAGYFGLASKADIPASVSTVHEVSLGSSIPVIISKFETSLQGKIATTDTSMTLVSGTDRNGTSLSGYLCFTIDENSSNVEYVCGTVAGTAVTAMTRGIDPVTGVTSVSALKKSHNRGASVKITDYPSLSIVSRILNGDDTLPNAIKYVSTVSTTTLASNTSYLANVAYVNGIALQGAPTATTTLPGVVQIGTTAQIAAGTGMTGLYPPVPAGSLFSQAFRSATTVPVTNATGTLASGFIDQTATYTWGLAVPPSPACPFQLQPLRH